MKRRKEVERRSSEKTRSFTFLSYDTDRIEDESNSSSIVISVFVATGKCLPSRCLATLWGIHI
jgi:hypothetical protein